ncbi:hypothetical protein GCM10023107_91100 [Actinoplanes octamycinicus]|nr:hypothetical protein Aoc01nite_38470 [Actinoplanes octamycinicus]
MLLADGSPCYWPTARHAPDRQLAVPLTDESEPLPPETPGKTASVPAQRRVQRAGRPTTGPVPDRTFGPSDPRDAPRPDLTEVLSPGILAAALPVAAAVCWARVRLREHTTAQVLAGAASEVGSAARHPHQRVVHSPTAGDLASASHCLRAAPPGRAGTGKWQGQTGIDQQVMASEDQ